MRGRKGEKEIDDYDDAADDDEWMVDSLWKNLNSSSTPFK